MLELLNQIIQEVNAALNLEDALEVIVKRVKQAIKADVCSVYLNDPKHQEHILMATDGLRPEAVGRVKLPMNTGLIGLVSKESEALNLADAAIHRSYVLNEETGEVDYHGFLGVPIIQHRIVLGVLVVRRREPQRFSDTNVTYMVTIAAQLAGAISHARTNGELARLQNKDVLESRFFEGHPGSPGVAVGHILVAYQTADLDAVPDHPVVDSELEIAAFRDALAQTSADLNSLADKMDGWLPAEDRALFDAWQMMLQSTNLREGTLRRIGDGNWAQGALRETINEHAKIFDRMDDPYLRERGRDIRDLGRRILTHLQDNVQTIKEYPKRTILAGEDLSAIQLATIPLDRLVGIVSTTGSKSSHIAILASGMGVPAVMGVTNLPLARMDGLEAILDGHRGRLYAIPDPSVRKEYQRLAKADRAVGVSLKKLRGESSCSLDGRELPLFLNTGLVSETRPVGIEEAAGVGLYRTELPFMVRNGFPSENIQFEEYRQVLQAFYPRSVTLRTLDIGGDKCLPYFKIEEENPFLGWRGIRISLDHQDLFITQIRAILRASVGLDNARILLPMISTVQEVDDALVIIHRAYQALLNEGETVKMPLIGAMVEVPAAIYQIAALAKRVDFLSVGTNDLTQYLLAVDRNNRVVASLYDDLHPAILRALCHIVQSSAPHGREVSVCGELAGNPMASVLLLGMGVTSLSMNAGSLLPVKAVVRAFTVARAQELLQLALACDHAHQVRELLSNALTEVGWGMLVPPSKGIPGKAKRL